MKHLRTPQQPNLPAPLPQAEVHITQAIQLGITHCPASSPLPFASKPFLRPSFPSQAR